MEVGKLKTKPKNYTIGWRMKKNTPTNRGYIYKLHLKRVQVKIKYPKLLEVYVNLDLANIYIKLFVTTNNAFFFGGIYIYIYTDF